MLNKIQFFFGVGTIKIDDKNHKAAYIVRSVKDLTNVIIPHFLKYPLLTCKRADFLLFKSIVELMNAGEHLTLEGLHKIVNIRVSMNKSLSPALKANFPNVIPVPRLEVEATDIQDPN